MSPVFCASLGAFPFTSPRGRQSLGAAREEGTEEGQPFATGLLRSSSGKEQGAQKG